MSPEGQKPELALVINVTAQLVHPGEPHPVAASAFLEDIAKHTNPGRWLLFHARSLLNQITRQGAGRAGKQQMPCGKEQKSNSNKPSPLKNDKHNTV